MKTRPAPIRICHSCHSGTLHPLRNSAKGIYRCTGCRIVFSVASELAPRTKKQWTAYGKRMAQKANTSAADFRQALERWQW